MGSNILGKHVSFERKEWLAHTLALAAKIKRKSLLARAPDPTPNKGDADSLTIVAHDTGPLVNISRQTLLGLLKISHLCLL
jgi:hypothetical protein